MRRLPHVTWLRAFEAAARHSSFASAADELNLTPAAVSQQIKLLEETLEMKLFKRLPKGVELTDIGQAYAQPVRKSFLDMQTATDALFKPDLKTTLYVRASISFGVLVLSPRLDEFRALHPEIDINLSTTVWSDRMTDATIDIDIRYGTGDWPEDEISHLGAGEASIVCHPRHAEGVQHEPASLKNADVVQIIGSEGDWGQMFDGLGVEEAVPQPWLQVDSSLLALQSIVSGRGVAISNTIFSQSYRDRGLLIEPFDVRLKTQGDFYLVARQDLNKYDQITIFRNWLVSVCAEPKGVSEV